MEQKNSVNWNLNHWDQEDYQNLIEHLVQIQEEGYQQFSKKLTPTAYPILGIRMPILKQLGKEIASGNYKEYLQFTSTDYHEEIMLRGIVIGSIKKIESFDVLKEYIKSFVPQIDNWAVNDTFCSMLKVTKKYKQDMWELIIDYLKSEKEFELRFAIIMLLDYYVEEEYIDEILKILDKINHKGYYVMMAVAWTLSVCFVKQEEKTLEYLHNNHLDNVTYNKALQKILESYRVSDENKEMIRKMKRKSS